MKDDEENEANDDVNQLSQSNSKLRIKGESQSLGQSTDLNLSERVKKNQQHERKYQIQPSNTDTPQIFKLNLDCFDELFVFLSLRDLNVLSQTCKRMQLIVGYFVRENLSAFELFGRHNGLYLRYSYDYKSRFQFESSIQKLRIHGYNRFENCVKLIRYIGANCNKNLKIIRFDYVQLTSHEIENIKDILTNVESVVISQCRMNAYFYDQFPLICKKLKNLYVEQYNCTGDVLKRGENNWLLRNWPKLKHFGWTQNGNGYRITEIGRFFQLNPNVCSFSTTFDCLCANRDLIIQSNVKLDKLTIEINNNQDSGEFIDKLMNELYDKEVYKRLHLYSTFFETASPQSIIKLTSIKGLEALRYSTIIFETFFSHLIHFTELKIGSIFSHENLNEIAKKFVNLERLCISFAFRKDYLPFIKHSPKLKIVKIKNVRDTEHSNLILDLREINEERKKLSGVRKVIIYLEDKAYLANKWNCKTIDLDLVEIRRAEEYEWNNYF